MKKYFVLFIVFVMAVASFSCITAPVCITASTTPIYGKMNVEKLGKTSGSSRAWSILGLWMIGRPDIGKAIDEALRAKNATALTDVRCYETWKWFLFFSTTTVYVEGEAVRVSEGR